MRALLVPLSMVLLGVGAIAQRPIDDIAASLLRGYLPATNDPAATFHALLATATRHAGHRASALLVEEASRHLTTLDDIETALVAVDGYLEARPDPMGRDIARRAKLQLHMLAGNMAAARAIGSLLPRVREWLVVGPYRDGSAPYLHVPYAPEFEFPKPGGAGQPAVRVLHPHPLRNQVDFNDATAPHTGCYYGLHQVACDTPTKCYLELTCSVSCEVFHDGDRIAVFDRDADRVPRRVFVPVSLHAGVNHVMVKLAADGGKRIMMRYLDADGRRPAGLSELPASGGVVACTEAAAKSSELPAFVTAAETLATAVADAVGPHRETLRLAACLAAFRTGDVERGVRWTHVAAQRAPTTTTTRLALAFALSSSPQLPPELRQSSGRTGVGRSADPLERAAAAGRLVAR